MTFFNWAEKPKRRVWAENAGAKRIIHVDPSEAMETMQAKIAMMTPEEIASNEVEANRLEAEFEAEQDAD